ncbi:aldo/keto reductase [Pelagimonas varians]|nr:aldo/keto reductase [Pelagimonas varians]
MKEINAQDGSKTSTLCFGCMQFGGTADAAASQAMFEACKEAGINFFDTAHTYTGGSSERMLGQFAKLDREKLIVATKAGYTGGSGRNNIIRQFDESRIRLGLDTVDILYLHRWDPETPLQETFETLEALQRSGKIRYIGVSNFAAWQVMKAQAAANIVGTRIDIIQPMYSLVKRQAEVELFPMALSEEIAVAPYSPLGSGLLTGKYFSGGAGRLSTDKRYAARYGQKWMLDAARALSELAAELSIDTATLSVAWAAQNAAVTAPIISARNVEQLKPSLDAKDVMLSAAVYARMEALSPRPAPATDRLEEASS